MSADLAATQRWMHAVISHPDGVDAGAASPVANAQFDPSPDFFDEVVTASATLTARQRLEVYHQGYFLRLINCLAELLPVLRHAMGEELFEMFAIEYLQTSPSASYTLAELDAGFVAYLGRTRPDRDEPDAAREDWPDFIIDLATLERDIRVTYDAPGFEGQAVLSNDDMAKWSDTQLLAATFDPVPCLALRAFRFPVRNYLLAVRRNENPALPAQQDTYLALTRRDFTVRLVELSQQQYELLIVLVASGDVSAAMAHAGVEDIAEARRWLTRFADAGLFHTRYHMTAPRIIHRSQPKENTK